jgi:hypothetical protein
MNKTKKVAWHKHLKRARKVKEKAAAARRASHGISGVHAQPARPAARAGAARP